MKITKIYSNDKRFREVVFNDHFNVILGEIRQQKNLNKDSHNLGKSTLLQLIDFMFLKEIDKNHFLKNKVFESHIFFMELLLNDGRHLTIRRGAEKNTQISFKFHNTRNQNFSQESNWDYLDLPLTTKDENRNPVDLLNRFLSFNVLINISYRTTVNYFFRSQNDYSDVFRLSKHKGRDLDWKPALFELLGFDSKCMIEKYQLEQEKDRLQNNIEDYKKNFEIDAGERDKISGLIEIDESKRKEILIWLDQFDFYKTEKTLNKDLVEQIEKEISICNSQMYDLKYEISQIQESLVDNSKCNFDEVLQVFQETNIYFPSALKKTMKI